MNPSTSRRSSSAISSPRMQSGGAVAHSRTPFRSTLSVAIKSAADLGGRFGWGLADQVLASATNFLLSLLVARTVGVRDLGAFSLAYATVTFSLGAVRAIAAELLVVRHSAVSLAEWRNGVKGSAGTAVVAGTVLGAGCLGVATVVGGTLGAVLAIVGVSLPLLLVQDVWRFALFARNRGSGAFANDAVWAGVMFAGFAVLLHYQLSSVAWFTLAWAGAGCVAALVGVFQLRVLPSPPRAALTWLRQHRDIAPRFLAEFGVGTGITHLAVFAIGAIAGLGELGKLRVGEIALAPLNVLFAGVGLAATPEFVRLLQKSPDRLLHACRRLSLVLAGGVLAWGAVIWLLPLAIGQSILRESWDTARSLLPPLVIALAGYGVSFGPWTGLRALAAARRSLRARCIDGVLTLIFGLGGAYLGGATGVAWGYAVTGCLRGPNAWWQFSRALRHHRDAREAPAVQATAAVPGTQG